MTAIASVVIMRLQTTTHADMKAAGQLGIFPERQVLRITCRIMISMRAFVVELDARLTVPSFDVDRS